MIKRKPVFTRFKLPWKARGEDRCPICGKVIVGEGVERYGKRLFRSWNADFFRSPPHWWRQMFD
jgi:hypothetical protein